VKLAVESAHSGHSDLHQMELPFTRVELDKTLTLAPNPKRVNGYWVTQSNARTELVEDMALDVRPTRLLFLLFWLTY